MDGLEHGQVRFMSLDHPYAYRLETFWKSRFWESNEEGWSVDLC